MSIVTIVGAGMMGSAMSIPLRDNRHEVRLVGTPLDRDIVVSVQESGTHPTLQRQLPNEVKAYQIEALTEALDGADVLIGGVSSFGVEWFAKQVLPHIPNDTLPVLLVTKGLAQGADGGVVTFPHLLKSQLSDLQRVSISAIGGPCTAYELADRRQSSVAFCGDDPDMLRTWKALLTTPYYHISLSTDVVGIESAVALKNAYALGVSLAIGLIEREEGVGCTQAYNPQAALFGQSVREITRLVTMFGGNEASVRFGIADLYVTIFGGRNRRLGTLLGRGLSFPEAIEALHGVTLESVAITTRMASVLRAREALGQTTLDDFPLLAHIDAMINQGETVAVPWDAFTTEYW